MLWIRYYCFLIINCMVENRGGMINIIFELVVECWSGGLVVKSVDWIFMGFWFEFYLSFLFVFV